MNATAGGMATPLAMPGTATTAQASAGVGTVAAQAMGTAVTGMIGTTMARAGVKAAAAVTTEARSVATARGRSACCGTAWP